MIGAKVMQRKAWSDKTTNNRCIEHVSISSKSKTALKLHKSILNEGNMKLCCVPHRQKLESLQLKVEHLRPEQQKQQLTTKKSATLYFSIYLNYNQAWREFLQAHANIQRLCMWPVSVNFLKS